MCNGFKRKALAKGGGCRFEGPGYQTKGVQAELQPVEVWHIVDDLQRAVEQNDGLDYLQVYSSADGRMVWAIDEGEGWTLIRPYEY